MTQKIYILEFMRNNFLSQSNKTYMSEHMKNIHKRKQAKQSLEEIFNNFYYKILYSYPFIGDYYINTML